MKNVIGFLNELKSNNDRPWFEANKEKYLSAKDEFESLVKDVAAEMNKVDMIEQSKIFRIYRDVRFSKDKSPYKENMGASFSRATKLLRGGYYLHVEPGNSFVGGGFWQPEPHDLKRIRDEFAINPEPIMDILNNKEFKDCFGALSSEDSLKTPPKGYDKALPAIDLIKYKSYVAMKSFKDADILKSDFKDEVVHVFKTLRPFFDYMSEVLTTNLDGESVV